MVRHRTIKRETSLESAVSQLATVILLNLTMYSLHARHDRYGMANQTVRVTKARKRLDNRVDAYVEDLTELLWGENAMDSQAARVNRSFLNWAIQPHARSRTARPLNLQESA